MILEINSKEDYKTIIEALYQFQENLDSAIDVEECEDSLLKLKEIKEITEKYLNQLNLSIIPET